MTTSFRMTPTFQAQIKRIARAERRTTNNWVRIVLQDAVKQYLSDHPDVKLPEYDPSEEDR